MLHVANISEKYVFFFIYFGYKQLFRFVSNINYDLLHVCFTMWKDHKEPNRVHNGAKKQWDIDALNFLVNLIQIWFLDWLGLPVVIYIIDAVY